jgi:hypothetical protein
MRARGNPLFFKRVMNGSHTSLSIGALIVLVAAFIDWKDTPHQHS